MQTLPVRAHHTFTADARSVAEARSFTRAKLEEWGAADLVDSATLLVSELVTNAVVHTGTPARLGLRLDSRGLRVEVEDRHPSRALPTGTTLANQGAEGGRGLLITAALASSWGVEYTATSKSVWALCVRDSMSAPSMSAPSMAVPTERSADGDALRVAAVEIDGGGLVTGWNHDAAALFGRSSAEALGRRYEELIDPLPGERPPADLTTGAAALPWQGSYAVLRRDGTPALVFASHVRNGRGEGSTVLLVPSHRRALLEHPVIAARSARTETNPLGLREDVLLRLGIDDYLALAVERVRDPISADASYLMLLRDLDDEFEVKAVSGLPDRLRGSRLPAGTPGTPDPRTPQLPVVVTDLSETDVPLLADTGLRCLVVVPVVVEGRVIGALAAASERVEGLTGEQAVQLQRFADSVAVATDRARLQASERERRSWLSFLAEAGDLLAGTLDQAMAVAITGQIVVPRLATWCAVHLDDERGRSVLQHVWHTDEQQVDQLTRTLATISPGQAGDTDLLLAGDSVTVLPLVARGQQIGHLTLGRPEHEPLHSEVLPVAEAVARRAALAIDNARAHGELRAVGQALQQSLLPLETAAPPGLDVGTVYAPAGEGSAAGGDFYDLFPTGGGVWCFVVGDVCGTGAEAAAVTGLARHTIRALAQAGFPVAAILERLNTAILDEGPRARFLTLVCGTLRVESGRVRTRLVNAGHPAPFTVTAGGQVRQVGRAQPLLGVLDDVAYTTDEHVLEPGDLFVVVTDGVLERRADGRMVGEDGLTEELAHALNLPAQAVAERVRRLVADFTDEPQRDDMAVLVVRVED